MMPAPQPGFWLVVRREWRWLLHDRVAITLIFGMPLFAFGVLAAVFSHPVIRGLNVVVVDADRSETSRAFVEHVAAAPVCASSSAPLTLLPRPRRSDPVRRLRLSSSPPISSVISTRVGDRRWPPSITSSS